MDKRWVPLIIGRKERRKPISIYTPTFAEKTVTKERVMDRWRDKTTDSMITKYRSMKTQYSITNKRWHYLIIIP